MEVNPVQFLLDCSTMHPVIKVVHNLRESVLFVQAGYAILYPNQLETILQQCVVKLQQVL